MQTIVGTGLLLIGFAVMYSFMQNPNPWLIAVGYLAGITGIMILVEFLEWKTYADMKQDGWIAKEGQAINDIANIIYFQEPLKVQDHWLERIQRQGIWHPDLE